MQSNAQHLLTAKTKAKTVCLKINIVAKTEFMLAGDFPGQPVFTTSSDLIRQVDDFKYTWDVSSKAPRRSSRSGQLWHSMLPTLCGKSGGRTLCYSRECPAVGSETACMTQWFKKWQMEHIYTWLLCKALNISWKMKVPNSELYRGVPRPSTLVTRRLQFAGHYFRAGGTQYQPGT